MTVKHLKPRLIDVVFFAQWAAVLVVSVYLYVSYAQAKDDSRTNLSLILKTSDNTDAITNLDESSNIVAVAGSTQTTDNLYMFYNIGLKLSLGPIGAGSYPILTAGK